MNEAQKRRRMTALAAKAAAHHSGLFALSRPDRDELVELVRVIMRTGDLSAERAAFEGRPDGDAADPQLGPVDPAFTAAMALVQTVQAQCNITPAGEGVPGADESER